MDAIEAIRTRRMIPRVTDERPTREEIAELLDLAVRAPTHHLTEPWRFHVLAGDARELLAKAIADEQGGIEDNLEVGRAKVARAPVIVVVTCQRQVGEKIVPEEEDAAVSMAMENLLLAAHAKGLGAMLRTGGVAYHPSVNGHLGLEEDERVMGFVYLGYPAADRSLTPRADAASKTRWVGWD